MMGDARRCVTPTLPHSPQTNPPMISLPRLRHTAPLLALPLLLACNPEELTCTLAGDLTGLTVELSAVPVGPFTVDIVIPR